MSSSQEDYDSDSSVPADLDRRPYERPPSKDPKINSLLITAMRTTSKFLYNFDDEKLEWLSEAFREVAYKKGSVIEKPGNSDRRALVLKSGDLQEVVIVNRTVVHVIRRIEVGMMFNELKLYCDSPSSNSLVAYTDVEVLYLESKDYVRTLDNINHKRRKIVTKILKSIPSLAVIGSHLRARLREAISFATFPQPKAIFTAGDKSSGFFVVLRGRVDIVHVETQEVITLKSGDWFGFSVLVKDDDHEWSMSAFTAVPHTVVGRLHRNDFKNIVGPWIRSVAEAEAERNRNLHE